jgi:hypothetical protein
LPKFGAKSGAFLFFSCAALGFAGLAKTLWRQKKPRGCNLFTRRWRARPSPAHTPRHRSALKPSTTAAYDDPTTDPQHFPRTDG